MGTKPKSILLLVLSICLMGIINMAIAWEDGEDKLINPSKLKPFVDDLVDMPTVRGYDVVSGLPISKRLRIGMFAKKWKFHRDMPATTVFAYGTSWQTASLPGPTIEALHGVQTDVTWENHLPAEHILPWDPTIPTAIPRTHEGVPTVVHLHGAIDEPQSDGNSLAWFTNGFNQTGPTWSRRTYRYHNHQHPGNLWYHDHAMGLTRVNILAGLIGAYIVRHHEIEDPLGLPSGSEFDRPLIVFDRSFRTDGSIYMNSTGNNPNIHPQWQPEYFGDAIIVNGKAWPRMTVRRRKYRFRIINASNARFFKFFFTNGLDFVHVGSDSAYDERPVRLKNILLAPSEIADLVVDFSMSRTNHAILANDAPYPYPSGDPVNVANSKVMKFVIKNEHELDTSRVPEKLIKYPTEELSAASQTRYIAMFEYTTPSDEPTHLFLNAKPYDAPATETPKPGTTEIWNIINLTEDNHPLHIHLGLFTVIDQTEMVDLDEFKTCMEKVNDAVKCEIEKHARGKKLEVVKHEKGWKNVYKMQPGFVTKILVRFRFIHSNESYPFDATADPGYVYHCHILDHEDNAMMRPLKLIN
ncbi:Multicopper oxidase, type 1 [Dillenia turbinata]|uniref:Multicopper oxidase, type 1 n=1 Tax=Dillenia turbinata TaxID=194707 RepID=A0AAN8V6G1_9MAGN